LRTGAVLHFPAKARGLLEDVLDAEKTRLFPNYHNQFVPWGALFFFEKITNATLFSPASTS
jgi:hypothetical protein